MIARRTLRVAFVLGAAAILAACIPDGTYTVGPGCKGCAPQFEGMYWSPGGDGCYFARLSHVRGTPSAVIASEFRRRQGVQIVMVQPTDEAFQTHGCTTWIPLTSKPLTDDPTSPKLTEWDYRVNTDIAAGTWEAESDPSIPGSVGCSWSRLSGFGHTAGEVIEEGHSSLQPALSRQVVRIQPTDAGFTSSGCTRWIRTG